MEQRRPPVETNDECTRLLGKNKHLRSEAVTKTLATNAATARWYEEARSYAAELASELLRLNPETPALP
jgi:hypothetical protein